MTVEVKTSVFTGPFDLLLHLITGNQVEIYDISLSDIVDDYLREVQRLEEIDLETATEFLLIAATLIELKSARLLPTGEEGLLDRGGELIEKRDFLIAKLLEHKTFKKAAEVIRERLVSGGALYPRTVGPDESFASVMPPVLVGVGVGQLAELATAALSRVKLEAEPILRHIYVPPIRFADVFVSSAEQIQAAGHIYFRDLTAACETRLDVGVHFLAVLELYKRELIDVEQFRTFGEIAIVWRGGETVDLGEVAAGVEAEEPDGVSGVEVSGKAEE